MCSSGAGFVALQWVYAWWRKPRAFKMLVPFVDGMIAFLVWAARADLVGPK